ncbi:MAG TPA: hypothetical protein VFG47_15825 [Geminicoccaceae bacterium]|nr:hypothetical protein [Geminicoccaceae bacterium]
MEWRPVSETSRPDGHDDGEAGRQQILALQQQVDSLQAELEELEPVIGAAILAATAFRLRDEEGLILALRGLVRGLKRFEATRADA